MLRDNIIFLGKISKPVAMTMFLHNKKRNSYDYRRNDLKAAGTSIMLKHSKSW